MAKELSGAEYWTTIAEIDYIHWYLSQMLEKAANRDGLVKMIDEATGYDKKLLKEAEELIARVRYLKSTLPKDDPHFKTTQS